MLLCLRGGGFCILGADRLFFGGVVDWLEKHAVGLSLGRIEELVRIFVQATKVGFWILGWEGLLTRVF